MNAKQIAFEFTGGAPTQRELIREYLHERIGQWVPMPDLYRASGAMAVHSRISDLNKPYRDAGIRAPYENMTDNSERPHKSWYRYNP